MSEWVNAQNNKNKNGTRIITQNSHMKKKERKGDSRKKIKKKNNEIPEFQNNNNIEYREKEIEWMNEWMDGKNIQTKIQTGTSMDESVWMIESKMRMRMRKKNHTNNPHTMMMHI